jgi:hypothetical protein
LAGTVDVEPVVDAPVEDVEPLVAAGGAVVLALELEPPPHPASATAPASATSASG